MPGACAARTHPERGHVFKADTFLQTEVQGRWHSRQVDGRWSVAQERTWHHRLGSCPGHGTTIALRCASHTRRRQL